MKTTLLLALMAACVAGVLGASPASALTPVALKPDCGYVFNSSSANPPGLDALAEQLITVLQIAGLKIPVTDWREADLESGIDGAIVGDGIPDSYQLAIVGAALCAGDPEITAAFELNKSKLMALVEQMRAVINAGTPLGTEMAALATALNQLSQTLPEGDEQSQVNDLVYYLNDTATSVRGSLTQYGNLILTTFPVFANCFAALGGIDSGIADTLVSPIRHLIVGQLQEGCSGYSVSNGRFLMEIDFLNYLCNDYGTSLAPALLSQCQSVTQHLQDAVNLINGLTLPNFTVFGSAKTGNEPLSGEGDYNGDGISNKRAYDIVKAAGGDRFAFVRAAASADPFWPGNPGLPVCDATGLIMLAAFLAAAGVVGINRVWTPKKRGL